MDGLRRPDLITSLTKKVIDLEKEIRSLRSKNSNSNIEFSGCHRSGRNVGHC
jgi:hypothetical protein